MVAGSKYATTVVHHGDDEVFGGSVGPPVCRPPPVSIIFIAREQANTEKKLVCLRDEH